MAGFWPHRVKSVVFRRQGGAALLFKNRLKKILRALVITIFYWHITTGGMAIAPIKERTIRVYQEG